MSSLDELNEVLKRYYKVSINLDGMDDIGDELIRVEDSDGDKLFTLSKACLEWSKALKHARSVVQYYMSFFENKSDILRSTAEEAKRDIKLGELNSLGLAKKCKIDSRYPDEILEIATNQYKENLAVIALFKKVAAELDSYAKFFVANYYSCFRKYKRIRNNVGI